MPKGYVSISKYRTASKTARDLADVNAGQRRELQEVKGHLKRMEQAVVDFPSDPKT